MSLGLGSAKLTLLGVYVLTKCQLLAGKRAHPDLNQGPADLQSAALTTELCTHIAISITRLCSETKDLMDRWVIDSVTRMAPRLARCEDSNPIGEPHSGMGRDTLPEWSKGVDSSSTSASCVGSNPTGVILPHQCARKLFARMLQPEG